VGFGFSVWGLARVYARARLDECHRVVSTMEIFGRGLSVQDECQVVCRGSSALGGERGGRCMWGCCEYRASRLYARPGHRRARGARVRNPRDEPAENERGVRVDDAPSRRATRLSPARQAAQGVEFDSWQPEYAELWTARSIRLRRPPSASSRVQPKRPGRPSAMARAISRRASARTTSDRPPRQTPRRRPDREMGEGELTMTLTV
jgi:hypothetical protein